jgi:hypothetical protein
MHTNYLQSGGTWGAEIAAEDRNVHANEAEQKPSGLIAAGALNHTTLCVCARARMLSTSFCTGPYHCVYVRMLSTSFDLCIACVYECKFVRIMHRKKAVGLFSNSGTPADYTGACGVACVSSRPACMIGVLDL